MVVAVTNDVLSISIEENEVVIKDLRIADPDLLDVVREAENVEQVVRASLTVGARVLRMTQTTVDAAVVEKRFAELEHRVDEAITYAIGTIAETAQQYLDPEHGALKSMLDELESALGDAFDPKSKASVLAKFEGLLTGGTADLKKGVREMVDPGNPESPLGRLRTEMATELKELRAVVDALRTQLAADHAGAEVLELTAIKGRKFEETAFEAVANVASLYGDEAELVGDSHGEAGGRCGDIVVTLNDTDAGGLDARYVVEAKDRKLSLKAALQELDKAMKNRSAKAAVLVFSRSERAPIGGTVQLFGNKAIVVLEKEDPDIRGLQIALAGARCAVQRQLAGLGGSADLETIASLVEEARRTLDSHTAIKRSHSAARNQIASAAKQVQSLIEGLDPLLAEIAAKLRG